MIMGALAAGAVLVSGGLQAFSQYQEGQAAAKQADYNAQVADMQSRASLEKSQIEQSRLKAEGTKTIAGQRVALGASGIDLTGESSLNLFSATRAESEMDVQNARTQGLMEAWGHGAEAAQYRYQGQVARRRSVLGPLGTAIGTAGKVGALSMNSSNPQTNGGWRDAGTGW
jgi:hypothetical protein